MINGMADHVHCVFGMRPTQSLSDLMRTLKANSAKWINEKRFVKGKFQWQSGYGGISYSKSDLPKLIDFVKNQQRFHQHKNFLQEFEELLKIHEVEYDRKYLFHDPYGR